MRDRIDCCRDCDDRYPGCGATCEMYKEQKRELEESKKIRNIKQQADLYFVDQVVKDLDKKSKNDKKNSQYRGKHDE